MNTERYSDEELENLPDVNPDDLPEFGEGRGMEPTKPKPEEQMTLTEKIQELRKTTQERVSFEYCIENFTHAALALLTAWEFEGREGTGHIDKYPFHKSFDEIVSDIIDWRDTQTGVKK